MAGNLSAVGDMPGKRTAHNATFEDKLPKWVLLSLILHGGILLFLFLTPYWPSSKREPPPSYVVDLVGGERIGRRNFGTSLAAEIKTKPPAPEPSPPRAKLVPVPPPEPVKKTEPKLPTKPVSPPPPQTVKKTETKAKTPPKVEKTKKEPPTEKIVLANKKKSPDQQIQKKDVVPEKPSKENEDTVGHNNPLEKVRERLIESAIERLRSRAAAAQGSQTASSDTKGAPLSSGDGEGIGAQSLGKGGAGGEGVLKSLEYIKYFNYMRATLKGNWAWAGPKHNLKVLVRFGVKENGEIVGAKIVESSGDQMYDESVIRAVRKSSPLPAPPENHRKDFADVEFSFQPDQVG